MTLDQAHQYIAAILAELARIFVPEARLTFVMRVPGKPDQTLFVSEDDPAEVEAAIRHLRESR